MSSSSSHHIFSPGVIGEFSDELKAGEVVFPFRALGDLSEKPVIYPTKWPPLIEEAMKRRGSNPIRLYADGIFDLCHYGCVPSGPSFSRFWAVTCAASDC